MTIHQLIYDLRRPIFVYTMAVPPNGATPAMIKSCKTRKANAEAEIDTLVRCYEREKG